MFGEASTAKIRIIVLVSRDEYAAAIANIVNGAEKYDIVVFESPRELTDHMDSRDKVKLVLTNTTIANGIMATKVFDAMSALPYDFDIAALRQPSYTVGAIARRLASAAATLCPKSRSAAP